MIEGSWFQGMVSGVMMTQDCFLFGREGVELCARTNLVPYGFHPYQTRTRPFFVTTCSAIVSTWWWNAVGGCDGLKENSEVNCFKSVSYVFVLLSLLNNTFQLSLSISPAHTLPRHPRQVLMSVLVFLGGEKGSLGR